MNKTKNAMKMYNILLALPLLALGACSDDDNASNTSADVPTEILSPVIQTLDNLSIDVTTDKALYAPGEQVKFTATGSLPASARIRYRLGTETVADEALTSSTWTWTTPQTDHRGYMADIYTTSGTTETLYATIAVDVSSDWKRFPRYGFIASYGTDNTTAVIADELAFLNRCHINGLQFYDWQNKHHWPLGGTVGNLLDTYKDIANRDISTAVVKDYISQAHGYGMKAMFYNLCYGALDDAANDGVDESWYIFTSATRTKKDAITFSSDWKSNIYLTDPSNKAWQQYIADRNDDVYASLNFDGFHIDQLGDRGTVYDYFGSVRNLPQGFHSFINAMKERQNNKSLVMNAVSNYGAQQIATTGNVDFLYTEMWSGEDQFSDLLSVLKENRSYSSGTLAQVFAAYINYNQTGEYFNTPGVLLTDAVMFAIGAAHLELGDGHMLCHEYFPNESLKMSDELRTAIVHYYDFLTAYQNLLRDGGTETSCDIATSHSDLTLNAWPPICGTVTTYAKQVDNKQVVHLLNFSKANSLSWRDMDSTQPEPTTYTNATLRLRAAGVKKLWVASPDNLGGAPQELQFRQDGDYVVFTVPTLKYWTMIVAE